MQGFAVVPPTEALSNVVFAVHRTIGPLFSHVIVLSTIVDPTAANAGAPFPVEPSCVVLVVEAFTEIS